MAKLPEFLKGYPVQQDHPLRKAPMTGWMPLHAWIVKKRKRLKMADYARLMVIELERESPRMHILQKLKGSFDVARRTVERREMQKLA